MVGLNLAGRANPAGTSAADAVCGRHLQARMRHLNRTTNYRGCMYKDYRVRHLSRKTNYTGCVVKILGLYRISGSGRILTKNTDIRIFTSIQIKCVDVELDVAVECCSFLK